METSTETPGTSNVVIQNVTADGMQVNVNGEIKEIKNNLDDLKSLLQKISAENFKSGDKIYNIGTITNAVFSAEIGKKTFNMYLCRKLTEALSVYSDDAKDFLINIRDADKADWETQVRYTRKANGYIISGFVGVLGMLLQKVISSGIDAFTSNNSRDYIEVCFATAIRTLQLLCFAFISKLWDVKNANKFELNRDQANVLTNFFNCEVELNMQDYLELLNTLVSIFDAQKIEYPFKEFNKDCLADSSSFTTTCKNLESIKSKLDSGQITHSTAFEAENELAEFLSVLSFLADYKMVSVKDISYNDIRNEEVQYLHSYTFLGVDNDDKLFSSKYKYDAMPISNDAVLIYKEKYQEGLNLFPFIIDVNALTNEMEVRICFYAYFEEKKKRLTYSDINKIGSDKNADFKDIGDPSQVVIQFNDDVEKDLESDPDHDVTGLMKDVEKFKSLQLNTVYKIFQSARKEISE
jgi:hypothetical protein